ncbi:MAG: glycyl-radical enzyme activating protein [Deltaproteobacteria bacterium]|nr:glycyl-radical enzyme activating protein [Deltaproteobacteria bacterium]
MTITGIVYDIQRYSIHDGPGIRTTVFLKGCPLCCHWCHNPEGIIAASEISFLKDKCTLCGSCAAACLQGCHTITADEHLYDREACTRCGSCVQACCFGALETVGSEMTAKQVVAEAERDRVFFETSGGGITLSGGEPLFQPAFAEAILKLAHERGLSTCVETSGFCSEEVLRRIMEQVDLFLYDVKETDPLRHLEFTGVSNERILRNLRMLAEAGRQLILRCPLVPGKNDRRDHAFAIASLADSLPGVLSIELEPYHPLGVSKSLRLGRRAAYDRDSFMKKEEAEFLAKIIRGNTAVPVIVK